ncbi:MAG: threonine-phosphate decarboxylase CobD [Pseudomonadota bacterium]
MDGDLTHGGALDVVRQRFQSAPSPWLDLSTGVNPFAYPHIQVSRAAMEDLPTRAMAENCRSAIATALDAPRDSVVLAPGSELLIRLLPTMMKPQKVVVHKPTYGDHKTVWEEAGCQVIESDDPLQCSEFADAVVLCNPNNPDGRLFSPADLESVRSRLALRGGWLIVDEAYADLCPSVSLARSGGRDGLIILRSFGKFYGLAGIRLGAMLAPFSLRLLIEKRLGSWPVSGAALEVGTRAYNDAEWSVNMRAILATARARLDRRLERRGLKIRGGTDLFRLIETPDAHRLWHHLARQGVYVRRFGWSPDVLRIGIPADEKDEDRLENALSI